MKKYWSLISLYLFFSDISMAAEPARNTFVNLWEYTAPDNAYIDGISAGLMANGGLFSLALSDSNHQDGIYGQVIVLNSNGLLKYESIPRRGIDIVGYTLVLNSNNSGFSELYYGESNNFGMVYGRQPNFRSLFASPNYVYPSYYNMGPSAGEVSLTNAGLEIIIPSWGGLLTVLNSTTGAIISQRDIYSDFGEYMSGHAAIGELHESPGEEIAIFGAESGMVLVFDSELNLIYQSIPYVNGGYAEGSGPAIVDIDLDGVNEIIIVGVAGRQVRAFNINNSDCKYFWNLDGLDYYFTSPIAGDIIGENHGLEVAVQSVDSIVQVLGLPEPYVSEPTQCIEGEILYTRIVGDGGGAWYTPGLANVAGGNGLDIITANYNNLEIIDVELDRVAYRFVDTSAFFYPSPIIMKGASTAPAALLVSGWGNGKVYRLNTRPGSPVPSSQWTHAMGNPKRNGTIK